METPESTYWGDNFLPQNFPVERQCSRQGKLDSLLIVAGTRLVTKPMLCETPVHRQIHTDPHLTLSEAVTRWRRRYNSKNFKRLIYQNRFWKKYPLIAKSALIEFFVNGQTDDKSGSPPRR